MSLGLTTIIAYLCALQLATRTKASPLLCSLIAVGIPFAITTILQWISIASYNLPVLENLLSIIVVMTFLLQLITSYIVFKKIQDEDSFSITVAWAIGGFGVIILVIPFVVRKLTETSIY